MLLLETISIINLTKIETGHTTCSLILCIFLQVLGTDELNAYLNKYHLELDRHLEALVGRYVLRITFLIFNGKARKVDVSLFHFYHDGQKWG